MADEIQHEPLPPEMIAYASLSERVYTLEQAVLTLARDNRTLMKKHIENIEYSK